MSLDKVRTRVFRLTTMLESLDILKREDVPVITAGAGEETSVHVLRWTWNVSPSRIPLRPLNEAGKELAPSLIPFYFQPIFFDMGKKNC